MKAIRLAVPIALGLILAVLLLWTAATVRAADAPYTVCPAGPPQCSYSTIQAAIDAAPPGGVILVASGVYRDLHDRPRYGAGGDEAVTQIVYITKSLTLRGGYLAPDFGEPPDPAAHPTVLDAQNKGRVAYVLGAAEPITVAISGLQMINGVASGGEQFFGGRDAGGGIYVVSTTLRLENSAVMSNTSYASAAGMYLYASKVTLQENRIVGNRVYGMSALNCCTGGGIVANGSDSMLLDNLIADNSAELTGGIDNWNGRLVMVNNVISGNMGIEGSGGVRIILSEAVIRNNRFVNNADIGLSIWSSSGHDVIAYNEFEGNSIGALIGPNSFGAPDSSVLLAGNRFAGNGYTGLSVMEQPDVRMINNVFVGEPGGGETAMLINNASADMLHTTVVGLPGYTGIGIQVGSDFMYLGHGARITLTNSIISGQEVGISVTKWASATVAGVLWHGNGVNVDNAGMYVETGASKGDPLFAADSYHLLAGSAAIDAGSDAGVTDDIDKFPRPYRKPDLGADEYWPREALKWTYAPAIYRGQ